LGRGFSLEEGGGRREEGGERRGGRREEGGEQGEGDILVQGEESLLKTACSWTLSSSLRMRRENGGRREERRTFCDGPALGLWPDIFFWSHP
jgi:hypothetical protein